MTFENKKRYEEVAVESYDEEAGLETDDSGDSEWASSEEIANE